MSVNTDTTGVNYKTDYGTIGFGYVADRAKSPLTGRERLRIVDFWREAEDDGAGKWIDASKCWEPTE